MAKTVLLGKKAYRVLKRYRTSLSLQPLDTEYPHTMLIQDPLLRTRWGHVSSLTVGYNQEQPTWYRRLSDDLFEKIA